MIELVIIDFMIFIIETTNDVGRLKTINFSLVYISSIKIFFRLTLNTITIPESILL